MVVVGGLELEDQARFVVTATYSIIPPTDLVYYLMMQASSQHNHTSRGPDLISHCETKPSQVVNGKPDDHDHWTS